MRKISFCLCGEDWGNLDITKYFKRPNISGILRVSNHHGNANEFAEREEWTGNFGLVFLFKNTLRRFRVDNRVDYAEEVYLPQDMIQDKELSIVDGLIKWVNGDDFIGPTIARLISHRKQNHAALIKPLSPSRASNSLNG